MRPVPVACMVLVASAGLFVAACSKPKAPPPITCQQFQQQAERCERQTLDLVRQRIMAESPDAAVDDRGQQHRMLEARFRKKILSGVPRTQCERYRSSGTETGRKRFAHMTDCCAKPGCDAFAECILHLGEL